MDFGNDRNELQRQTDYVLVTTDRWMGATMT